MPHPTLPTLREALECPHCGEPTLPNALADGSLVCSCAAERSLGAPNSGVHTQDDRGLTPLAPARPLPK
jgi:hypothetical protein